MAVNARNYRGVGIRDKRLRKLSGEAARSLVGDVKRTSEEIANGTAAAGAASVVHVRYPDGKMVRLQIDTVKK